MPRKPDPTAKTHDPAYLAERNRQVRQRNRSQVSIRIPEEMLERWHRAAAERDLTLKEWIVDTLEREVGETQKE